MATISGWTEAAIIAIVFIAAMGFIFSDLNSEFGLNYNLPFSNQTQSYLNDLADKTSSSGNQLEQSTAKESAFLGLFPITYYSILKTMFSLLGDIVSGNWIPTAIYAIFGAWNGAVILARGLQIIYISALIYALIRVFVRIKP